MKWNTTIPKTNRFENPTTHEEMHQMAFYYAFSKSAKKRQAIAAVFNAMVCEHGYIVVTGTPNCYEWDGQYISLHRGMPPCQGTTGHA